MVSNSVIANISFKFVYTTPLLELTNIQNIKFFENYEINICNEENIIVSFKN